MGHSNILMMRPHLVCASCVCVCVVNAPCAHILHTYYRRVRNAPKICMFVGRRELFMRFSRGKLCERAARTLEVYYVCVCIYLWWWLCARFCGQRYANFMLVFGSRDVCACVCAVSWHFDCETSPVYSRRNKRQQLHAACHTNILNVRSCFS